jgi:hypothetical protein
MERDLRQSTGLKWLSYWQEILIERFAFDVPPIPFSTVAATCPCYRQTEFAQARCIGDLSLEAIDSCQPSRSIIRTLLIELLHYKHHRRAEAGDMNVPAPSPCEPLPAEMEFDLYALFLLYQIP